VAKTTKSLSLTNSSGYTACSRNRAGDVTYGNQIIYGYLMRLSKNFWLSEMFKSTTASRLGIDNTTTDRVVIGNLKELVTNVWQPVRDEFGTVIVSSGYRCLELNRALRSSDKSQHIKGEAIDGECLSAGNAEVALWISSNLDFDQLILEHYEKHDPRSGWVHCSYSKNNNRNQVLTINSGGVFKGLVY